MYCEYAGVCVCGVCEDIMNIVPLMTRLPAHCLPCPKTPIEPARCPTFPHFVAFRVKDVVVLVHGGAVPPFYSVVLSIIVYVE